MSFDESLTLTKDEGECNGSLTFFS